MPRKPRPRLHQGWWITDVGGVRTKLCKEEDGVEVAVVALEKLLAEQESDRAEARKAGILDDGSSYTFGELAALFLRHKELNNPKVTQKYYQSLLKPLVKKYGKMQVKKMNLGHWTEFAMECKNRGLKNKTINHYIIAARSVFRHAMKSDMILRNPWRAAETLPESGRKRVATDTEVSRLINACSNQRMKDLISVIRHTALRPSEARKLKWDHVNKKEGLIVIPWEEHKTGRKTKTDRIVPFMEDVEKIFNRLSKTNLGSDFVFWGPTETIITQAAFSLRFHRLVEKAKIPKDKNGEPLVLYSLRHTRLTEIAVVEGWEPHNVMMMAGHTNLTTTGRYIHVHPSDLIRASKAGAAKRKEISAIEKYENMLSILTSAREKRGQLDGTSLERKMLMDAVNELRVLANLPPITEAAIMRCEAYAGGDPQKFARHCVELSKDCFDLG